MERAEARRLQPHYIRSFFLEAFRLLGGTIREREPGRYEITHVPAAIRNRDRLIGVGEPGPAALRARHLREGADRRRRASRWRAFVCPGHPLLDATVDLVLERYRDLLKRARCSSPTPTTSEEPRALVYLEHAIQDARELDDGQRQVVSRRLQFVELDRRTGEPRIAGYAPYLDYRPLDRRRARPRRAAARRAEWLDERPRESRR